MNRWRRYSLVTLLGVGFVMPGQQAAGEEAWCSLSDPVIGRKDSVSCPARTNPQKLPQELVLPMPCGQSMILRKIVVPGESFLDHQKLSIGGGVSEQTSSEVLKTTLAPRDAFLAGSFAHGEGERETEGASKLQQVSDKSYYIGKYEVMAHQYKLFEAGLMDPEAGPDACKDYSAEVLALTPRDVRPKGGLSWFDGISFVRAYSNWLLALDKQRITDGQAPSLPWEYGSTSYVRLPTEVEWEFAARGGLARTQDQTIKTYNVRDPETGDVRLASMNEVAVVAAVGSRLRDLRPVGTRLPNVLGLYDTIGGVSEIVLDPFSATRPDNPHGQVGGYIVKGGNAKTQARLIGVGHRSEVPFFDNSGETRNKLRGIRVAVSTPVFVAGRSKKKPWRRVVANPDLDAALSKSRDSLVASVGEDRQGLERSLAELQEKLRSGDAENSDLLTQIGEAQYQLEVSNAKINQRNAAVRYERFRSLVFTARSINQQGASIFLSKNWLGLRRDAINQTSDLSEDSKQELIERLEGKFERRFVRKEAAIDADVGLYIDILQQAWTSESQQIDDDSRKLRTELERSGSEEFIRYVAIVGKHLDLLKASGGTLTVAQRQELKSEIDEFQSKRGVSSRAN